jgi:CRP-like cAMP-binding protein
MILDKPESKLCTQEEKNKDPFKDKIFFLAKGKCEVTIQDRFENNRILVKNVRTLIPGDNFGEISMLF